MVTSAFPSASTYTSLFDEEQPLCQPVRRLFSRQHGRPGKDLSGFSSRFFWHEGQFFPGTATPEDRFLDCGKRGLGTGTTKPASSSIAHINQLDCIDQSNSRRLFVGHSTSPASSLPPIAFSKPIRNKGMRSSQATISPTQTKWTYLTLASSEIRP